MDRSLLEMLARTTGQPAVSILCPFDPHRPGNPEDRLRLSELRAEVADRLDGDRSTRPLLERLDEAVATIDFGHPRASVGIFVGDDVTQVVSFDVPMPARAVVADCFALREVAAALSQSVAARALVLSRARTRCFDLDDATIVERGGAFPVEVVPPTREETPHHDFPLDEHERDEAAKFVFRAVAHAFKDVQHHDPRPLVLFGPERDLAYFDAVEGDAGATVIGRVHGNYDHAGRAEIEDLARPHVESFLASRHDDVLAELHDAPPAHVATGHDEVTASAADGRGRVLVVEAGTEHVDRLIRDVVAHSGRVEVVPDGTLQDFGGLALLLRY